MMIEINVGDDISEKLREVALIKLELILANERHLPTITEIVRALEYADKLRETRKPITDEEVRVHFVKPQTEIDFSES